eukprot:GHVS01061107.1.p1 GENE.GHVS01061107.1~~GHVS01061107.1.p1  ORF type:complete len:349 (+),score=24.11 GHVS01061107.1:131-1048(+)
MSFSTPPSRDGRWREVSSGCLHSLDAVVVARGNLSRQSELHTTLRMKIHRRSDFCEWTHQEDTVWLELIDLWAVVMNFVETQYEIYVKNVPWSAASGALRLTRETLNANVIVIKIQRPYVFEPANITTESIREADLTSSCFTFLPRWVNENSAFHGHIPQSSLPPKPLRRHRSGRVYTQLAHLVLPEFQAAFYAVVWDVHQGMRLLNYGENPKCCMTLKLVDPSVDISERHLRADIDEEVSYLLELRADQIRESFPLFTMGDVVRCHRVSVRRTKARPICTYTDMPTLYGSADVRCDCLERRFPL